MIFFTNTLLLTLSILFIIPSLNAEDISKLPKKETLTIAFTKSSPDISGIGETELSSNQLSYFLYDWLFTYNPINQYEFSPIIATTTESNPDKTIWTIGIKKGVSFHDGSTLTAHDVKFSIDQANTEGNNRKEFLNPIKNVEIVDDYQIRIHLTSPKVRFIKEALYNVPIVPKKVIEKIGFQTFKNNPIGSGPYKFVSMEKDKYIHLERYDTYWGGVPPIKHLLIKLKVKPETIGIEIEAGNIDIAPELSLTTLDLIVLSKKVDLKTPESLDYTFIAFNLKQTPTHDVRFRKAILHAFNFSQFINDMFKKNNGGIEAYSPIPPSMWPQDLDYQKKQSLTHNPIEAERIFKQLESEGVLKRSEPLNFVCRSNNQYLVSILRALANTLSFQYNFKKINLIQEPSWDTFTNKLASSHIYTFAIGHDYPDPNIDIFQGDNAYNFNGYNDSSVNNWLSQEDRESENEKRTELLVKVMRKTIYEDYAVRLLFHGNSFFLVSKRVKDLHVSGTGYYYVFIPFQTYPIKASLE